MLENKSFNVDNQIKKKITKSKIFIFTIVFILINILVYYVEYKRYVNFAPTHLKEARKEFVNAIMFHTYYTFLVKTVRIDFQNPILFPLKAPRDYFYHRGLDKLPKEEAERALWFDMFEARLYNYSVKAKYGSMAKHYGYEFSKNFIDRVYENIKILSLYEISDKKTSDISEDVLEAYIDLIHIFVADYHLSPRGYMFRPENMKKVSLDKKLHERFNNIYMWKKDLLAEYKRNDINQYNKIMNSARGLYSPYRNSTNDSYRIASYILFYKINNETFDCKEDKKYLDVREESKDAMFNLLNMGIKNSKNDKLYKDTDREFSYLSIMNKADNHSNIMISGNPLQLIIDCNYTKKEI